MHTMSTNFAKTLVWKHGNDVKLWRHKQCTPKTNNRHMTLNQTPSWKFSAYATGLKWMTVSILLFWGWELVSVITVCGTKRLNPFSGFYEASELNQARNQLGTPGGTKSFLRGAQIFELSPTHFPRGEKKFYWGISPPWLRACNKCVMWVWSNYFTAAFFVSFTVTVFVPDSAVVANFAPRNA